VLSPQLRLWITGSLRQALWAPALVLLFWATAAKGFGAYLRYPWLDMPTHFFGGVASAYFFDVCLANLNPVLGPIHALLRLALSFSLVAVAAIVWECLEYLSDLLLGSHLNLGVTDTLSDLLFGLLGALCFVVARLVRGRPLAPARDGRPVTDERPRRAAVAAPAGSRPDTATAQPADRPSESDV
jgi:hypothetical protein